MIIESINAIHVLLHFFTALILLPHKNPASPQVRELHEEKATSDSAGHKVCHKVLYQELSIIQDYSAKLESLDSQTQKEK